MAERDKLIHELRALGRRLTVSWPAEEEIASRLVRESLEHLMTGSNGRATAMELDLVAWTFEAQNRMTEAALLQRTARFLTSAAIQSSSNQKGIVRLQSGDQV